MTDPTVDQVKRDVEARAIDYHAQDMWNRLSDRAKSHYRLKAAEILVHERENVRPEDGPDA